MRNILSALCLVMISSVFVFAQTDDYKKTEFYVGYSNGQVKSGVDETRFGTGEDFKKRESFNGFEVSGVYNVNRYVGIKADVSGTYNKSSVDFTALGVTPGPTRISFTSNNSLYNVLGGVQVKDNATRTRIKPFAHALAGVGIAKSKIKNFNCTSVNNFSCSGLNAGFNDSNTAFALAVGGGLDVKVSDRIDIRAIQLDYNPIFLGKSTNLGDSVQNNFRIGFGIVFH